MKSKRSRSPRGEARLKAFLARPTHPEGTLSLGELRGFLFALASAPELVKPSEWIPFIFADEEPGFRDMEEAEEVMGALMHLYNAVNESVRAKGPRLPPGCVFLDPPMANLEPEAPVSQWARGFSAAHMWLEAAWDRYLPAEFEADLGSGGTQRSLPLWKWEEVQEVLQSRWGLGLLGFPLTGLVVVLAVWLVPSFWSF